VLIDYVITNYVLPSYCCFCVGGVAGVGGWGVGRGSYGVGKGPLVGHTFPHGICKYKNIIN